MAILDETKVVDTYDKKDVNRYQKIMFPSDCIAMSDGTDLEERNTFYKRNAVSGVLYRYGNVVHFHHELVTTLAMKNLNWQIIPEGYRPITIERQSFMTINNNNPHCWIMISISPDGACSYFSNKSDGLTEFFFDMYYFTNDPVPADEDIMTI